MLQPRDSHFVELFWFQTLRSIIMHFIGGAYVHRILLKTILQKRKLQQYVFKIAKIRIFFLNSQRVLGSTQDNIYVVFLYSWIFKKRCWMPNKVPYYRVKDAPADPHHWKKPRISTKLKSEIVCLPNKRNPLDWINESSFRKPACLSSTSTHHSSDPH